MIAIFNSQGTLLELDSEPLIQGSVNQNTLYCGFQSVLWSNYPRATITFKRSDGSVSPELLMTQHSLTYEAVTYQGYKFSFYDHWFLSIAGALDITIRLYNSNALNIFVQGRITTSVQKSVSEITNITPSQYQDLLQQLILQSYDVDNIVFDEDYEPQTLESGTLFYDNTANIRTLAFYHTYENGQSMESPINQTLYGIGKNNEGAIIYKGMCVYFKDVEGNHILMGKASTSTPQKQAMVGVAGTQTANNEYGPALTFGYVKGVNLNQVMDSSTVYGDLDFGTKLYLSGNVLDLGKYTTIKPTYPTNAIWVATIIDLNKNNYTNATLFIYPQREAVAGGTNIQVSDAQPNNQVENDLWYDII